MDVGVGAVDDRGAFAADCVKPGAKRFRGLRLVPPACRGAEFFQDRGKFRFRKQREENAACCRLEKLVVDCRRRSNAQQLPAFDG
jgi:hypothetical protein